MPPTKRLMTPVRRTVPWARSTRPLATLDHVGRAEYKEQEIMGCAGICPSKHYHVSWKVWCVPKALGILMGPTGQFPQNNSIMLKWSFSFSSVLSLERQQWQNDCNESFWTSSREKFHCSSGSIYLFISFRLHILCNQLWFSFVLQKQCWENQKVLLITGGNVWICFIAMGFLSGTTYNSGFNGPYIHKLTSLPPLEKSKSNIISRAATTNR